MTADARGSVSRSPCRLPIQPPILLMGVQRVKDPARKRIAACPCKGTTMLIKNAPDVRPSEITPRELYINRRKFMRGVLAGGAALAAGVLNPAAQAGDKLRYVKSDLSTTGEKLTPLDDITGYNNFYEFGTDKEDPARNAKYFRSQPWTISVEGLVGKPGKYDVEGIIKMHPSLEEHVYRMRCVEGWSMVIPWIGIPLNSVIKTVQPTIQGKIRCL